MPTLGAPAKDGSTKPLIESNIISEYLDWAYPKSGPKLFPEDPFENAHMKIWVDHVTDGPVSLAPVWKDGSITMRVYVRSKLGSNRRILKGLTSSARTLATQMCVWHPGPCGCGYWTILKEGLEFQLQAREVKTSKSGTDGTSGLRRFSPESR